ncbi:MAG: S8 family serine peptidase [Rubrivivax sp.]
MATDVDGNANLIARTYPELTQVSGASPPPRRSLMWLSGTSVAAPVVAGAAAVLLQANPGLTPALVKAMLQYTAEPLPTASVLEQGTGQVNLEGAVRLAQALRKDIGPALARGRLKAGDNLLAAGRTPPQPRSTIGGRTFDWSGIAFAGGNRLVSGNALFEQWQPVYEPGLTWARQFVVRSHAVTPAGRRPAALAEGWLGAYVETAAAPQGLLGPGVRLLDLLAASPAPAVAARVLVTPVTQLAARVRAGVGVALANGLRGERAVQVRRGRRLRAEPGLHHHRRLHPHRGVHPHRRLHPDRRLHHHRGLHHHRRLHHH